MQKRSIVTGLLLTLLLASAVLPALAARQTNPVRITLWHIATESDPFRPVLQEAIDRFNAAHADVQIAAQAVQNEDFKDRLREVIGTDDQPDVFQTWGGGWLQSLIDSGPVREIPELDAEAGERFSPAAFSHTTFDGRHYAVPVNLAGVFLWYNEELFARHDVELPTTWDRLIAACATFRQAGVVPIALGNRDRWPGGLWFTYLALRLGGPDAIGGNLGSADTVIFDQNTFIQAGEYLQEAARAGCFEDDQASRSYGDAQQLLATGAAAMQLQGDWNLGGLRGANADFTANNLRVMPFPDGEEGQGDFSEVVGGTGQAFAISADAPPETASALIELFGSPDYGLSVAEAGFIPALAGSDVYIADPLVREMASIVADASVLQLYYDQLLPLPLDEAHLESTRRLIDLSLSPEQAAGTMVMAGEPLAADLMIAVTPVPGLRDLAEARGVWIGAAASVDALRSDPAYAEILAREYNALTPEMAMKMDALRPNRETFAFENADYLVDFAEANGMAVHGHTLVWYRQLPGWLEQGVFSRDELLAILREHITTVVSRYRGRVAVWDVVNEAVNDDGSLRNNIWLQGIGPEYIDLAFQWAHEADPDVLLLYNDYDAEGSGPKSDAVYNLVAGLVQRGVPIHGVGLQMHISIGSPPRMEDIAANIQRLAALGLEVQITEMDVRIQDGSGTEEERFAQQARLYSDVARLCLSTPACTTIITWGFTDRYSWVPQWTGNPDAALPFDANYQPKPAYFALVDALSP